MTLLKVMLPAAIGLVLSASGQRPDAVLETSSGDRLTLASLQSKPIVLFYEDRESTTLNQPLKDALFQRARERGLLEAVKVVAVANVKAYNWFPARNFVLKAVRDIEKKVKVPIYLDFIGSLAEAPWSLPSHSSTVVVFDGQGQQLLQLQGKLEPAQIEQLLSMLETLATSPR